ncbi:hypothetical protein TYRP_016012 [Tyrophagus putrescentiae]|nr:hypothetical protein TYRP_016012 [Tyrophagus putrescentiae]
MELLLLLIIIFGGLCVLVLFLLLVVSLWYLFCSEQPNSKQLISVANDGPLANEREVFFPERSRTRCSKTTKEATTKTTTSGSRNSPHTSNSRLRTRKTKRSPLPLPTAGSRAGAPAPPAAPKLGTMDPKLVIHIDVEKQTPKSEETTVMVDQRKVQKKVASESSSK